LATPFRPEQLVFELLGLIECQMAHSPAVVDRLPNERGSKMACVRIANGACRRRDWHAFDPLNIARLEVRVVERQALRHGTTNPECCRQRRPALGRRDSGRRTSRKGFPSWLRRVEVLKKDGVVHHPVVMDTRSLLWIANQNTVTVHVWASRTPKLN
jgi:LigD-like primase-polymerase